MNKKEANDFMAAHSPVPNNTTYVYFIDNYLGGVSGIADLNGNLVIIEKTGGLRDLGVFLHEFGHAHYGLVHPVNVGGTGKGPKDDTWNFMFRHTSSTNPNRGSRNYQWHKMKFL